LESFKKFRNDIDLFSQNMMDFFILNFLMSYPIPIKKLKKY